MTFADSLQMMKAEIERLLREFVSKFTSIQPQPLHRESGICIIGSSYWLDLKPGGKPAQTALLQKYRQFHAIVKVVAAGHSSEDLNEVDQSDKTLLATIEQTSTAWEESTKAVVDKCVEALDQQIGLLAAFAPSATDASVFVPDTNALLFNPDLEKWSFEGYPSLLLVLLPVVLSEIDKLKIEHRNEDVRKKAEGLINRIKEYRRRGSLCDGVPLKTGVSQIMSVATEPDFSTTLPWLDSNNADDRLLASFLEVVRRFPHSPVTLVTRDINLQNKAEFARLPFVEPPPPQP
jgi:hypothetical protein